MRWTWIGAATLVAAVGIATSASASDKGMAAADQVSQTSYYGFMNNSLYTHVGNNRGRTGAHLVPCRNNIQAILQSYGLTVTLEAFTYSGTTYHNVVAKKVGTRYPTREYIIGGHYDSASNPGADDDASGVAAVLEAARILSQYPSDCTIRFIGFSMEETGLDGSEAYVTAHAADDIRGMVSADMVAYDTGAGQLTASIFGRTASDPIKNALAAAVTEYGNGLIPVVGGDMPYSDHAPFEADGLQACLLIEGEESTNPFYHQSTDNFEQAGNLNFPYALKMTRALVGWLVDAAGVQVPVNMLKFNYPNGLPDVAWPNGQVIRVAVESLGTEYPDGASAQLHYNIGAGWVAVPMSELMPGLYDAVLPPSTCGTTIKYYFSIQSLSYKTYVDPHGAPDQYYTVSSGYEALTIYETLLNSNPGWALQGGWAFGHPTGGGTHNLDPNNGHTGTNVYGYVLTGDYPSNMTTTQYLTTPAIDCTGARCVKLEFWRWLGVESNSDYDKAMIEVSRNNGTSWTVIWRASDTGGAVADTAWTLQTFDLAALADNQPAVKIRWGLGPTDGSLTYPGWNIDDIRITGISCTPPPSGACCTPDGACTVSFEVDCAGTYLGDNTLCDPNLCPQPTGACCLPDGSCTEVAQLECTGLFGGVGTTCAPNPCAQPTGACCLPDGSCSEVAQAACAGVFDGVGTSCAPNPCPPPTCAGDGNCDGAINWRDIDYLVAGMNDNESAWASLFPAPGPSCLFANLDASGDGAVNWRDIDPFVALMNTTCP